LLVSILINNYNYGRFLDHCVRSVLSQTYDTVEVIAYDDGSTDGSLEVLRRYAGHVRVIAAAHGDLPPAFNQANAINRAFEASSGDLVCLLDSDDAFLPDKVQSVVRAIRNKSDAVMVQHPFEEIDESGHRTGVVKPFLSGKDPRASIYRTHSLAGLFTQTSGLSFRRTYLDRVLPIEPDRYDKIWPDVRLSRLAMFHGTVITLPDPLAEHRMHGANDSAKLGDDGFFRDAMDQMYAFFNQQAALYGWDPIDPAKSVTRPGLRGVKRLVAQLQATEGWPEKADLIVRMLKKATRQGGRSYAGQPIQTLFRRSGRRRNPD